MKQYYVYLLIACTALACENRSQPPLVVVPDAADESFNWSEVREEEMRMLRNERILHPDAQVKSGEMPWMVLFKSSTSDVRCGGSLIRRQWVLTAAHCGILEGYRAFLGTVDDRIEGRGEELIRVKKVFSHCEFNHAAFYDADLALVWLDSKSKHQPIKLPTPTDVLPEYVTQAGWGITDDHTGNDLAKLRRVKLKVDSMAACSKEYDDVPIPQLLYNLSEDLQDPKAFAIEYPAMAWSLRWHEVFNVTDRMFCAGGDWRGACKNDSGGPAIEFGSGDPKLVGVISFSRGLCGEFSVIHGLVSKYISWIEETIKKAESGEELEPCPL